MKTTGTAAEAAIAVNRVPSNAFATVLGECNHGWDLQELSERLALVVEGVRRTGKAGSLTCKLKVKPASKGAGSALVVDVGIEAKIPQADRDNTIFFANKDNGLQRNNPEQKEFAELKTVTGGKPAEATALRAVTG